MKKLLALLLAFALFASICVTASAQSSDPYEDDDFTPISDDYEDTDYGFDFNMTQEELDAIIDEAKSTLPDDMSDTMSAFMNALFDYYKYQISILFISNDSKYEKVTDYFQNQADTLATQIELMTNFKNAVLKLTEDDVDAILAYLKSAQDTLDDINMGDIADDYSSLLKYENLGAFAGLIDIQIAEMQENLDKLNSLLSADDVEEGINAVVNAAFLLINMRDDTSEQYEESAMSSFYEDYSDAEFGFSYIMDDWFDDDEIMLIGYSFAIIGDNNFYLPLYVNKACTTKNQYDKMVSAKEELAKVSAGIREFLAAKLALFNVDTLESQLDEYIDAYENFDVKYGDANGDGKVTAADVLILRKKLASWQRLGLNERNSDANGDGKVTAADVLILRKKLANWPITLGPREVYTEIY